MIEKRLWIPEYPRSPGAGIKTRLDVTVKFIVSEGLQRAYMARVVNEMRRVINEAALLADTTAVAANYSPNSMYISRNTTSSFPHCSKMHFVWTTITQSSFTYYERLIAKLLKHSLLSLKVAV